MKNVLFAAAFQSQPLFLCRFTIPQFIVCCLLIILPFFQDPRAFASELVLNPATPRPNDRISLIYTPDSAWKNAQAVYALVYRFNEISGEPEADYTQLTKRGDGRFYGDFQVLKTDVFLMMKLFNGKRYDDNGGNYWDVRISADGTKPVQGAYLRQAISLLGSLPSEINRASDFPKALALMREELKLYPNNLAAKVAEIALGFDLKDISEDDYRRRLQSAVSMPFDTTRENDTRAVMRGLNALGASSSAKTVENAYRKRFPNSKLAEESVMQSIQTQTVPDWFLQQAVSFVNTFTESPTAPMMQSAAVATFAQTRRLTDAAKWLDTLKNPSPFAYNELAKYWCRMDTSEERGLKYAHKALDLAKRLPLYRRPPHISEIEWNINTNASLGDIYNTLGGIYLELKRPDSALAVINQAVEITENSMPAPSYSILASILFEKKQYASALEIASKGIIASGGDEVLLKWHRRAFDSTLTSKKDTAKYLDILKELQDSASALVKERQMGQRMNRPMIEGKVFTTDRAPVEFSSFKGTPTLLVFWTSWAEPCVKSMPFINLLFKRYQESGRAKIVVIDAWEEKGKDQYTLVRDYMARNSGLYFPIYVDENNVMAQKYGVTGLPMRIYLDKNGRIQYKGSGFTDGLKLTQEIEETMQLLMSERFYAAP